MLKILLTALMVAITFAAQSQPALRIAVNTTTIESFPVFLAAEANVAGVELVMVPNGRAAMAQLVSGAVDAATGSETQALLNSVADPRIRIVLTLSECRYRIIARRSDGIRRVSDLRGKRVAATLNTSSQYLLAGMLGKANLAESDVEIVPLEGQEMPAALKSGIVSAVAIWEPHAQNSLEAIGSDAVVLEDPSVYIERFNLNTRTDVLSDPQRRLALKRFVQAIQTASARIRQRPPGLLAKLAPRVGLTERVVGAVWGQFRFPASLSNELGASLDKVEPWVAAMQKRQPRSSAQLASLIDGSLLLEQSRD
jgi:NitT/TauT family transport system substrate-binding protein